MLPEEAYALAYAEVIEGRFDRHFTDSEAALAFLEAQMRSHLTEEVRAQIRAQVHAQVHAQMHAHIEKARAVGSPASG